MISELVGWALVLLVWGALWALELSNTETRQEIAKFVSAMIG